MSEKSSGPLDYLGKIGVSFIFIFLISSWMFYAFFYERIEKVCPPSWRVWHFPLPYLFRFLHGVQQLLDKCFEDVNGHAEAGMDAQNVYYALLLLTIRRQPMETNKMESASYWLIAAVTQVSKPIEPNYSRLLFLFFFRSLSHQCSLCHIQMYSGWWCEGAFRLSVTCAK